MYYLTWLPQSVTDPENFEGGWVGMYIKVMADVDLKEV